VGKMGLPEDCGKIAVDFLFSESYVWTNNRDEYGSFSTENGPKNTAFTKIIHRGKVSGYPTLLSSLGSLKIETAVSISTY
jgi:hypothetical protein